MAKRRNTLPISVGLTDAPMEKWLSDFFGFPVTIRHESEKGFPDDREAFGPTIVSEASLHAIQSGIRNDPGKHSSAFSRELGID